MLQVEFHQNAMFYKLLTNLLVQVEAGCSDHFVNQMKLFKLIKQEEWYAKQTCYYTVVLFSVMTGDIYICDN